jgi:hypothetical protein
MLFNAVLCVYIDKKLTGKLSEFKFSRFLPPVTFVTFVNDFSSEFADFQQPISNKLMLFPMMMFVVHFASRLSTK